MIFLYSFSHDGKKITIAKESSGKSTWKLCNQIALQRSEVVLFVQMFVTLMLIVLCIVKLTALSLVGHILPNSRL